MKTSFIFWTYKTILSLSGVLIFHSKYHFTVTICTNFSWDKKETLYLLKIQQEFLVKTFDIYQENFFTIKIVKI